MGTGNRYSGDNVTAWLRFANGSQGTITYLANGDRSFSKERLEVFGGGGVGVVEDFRRLELVRNGRKETVHSRWHQDKGHAAEWTAFADFVQHKSESPIAFEDILCATLATLRLDESLSRGQRFAVDVAEFVRDSQCDSESSSSRNE
jgi:predicted dehydrogenase